VNVAPYGCETGSVALKEIYGLMMSDIKVALYRLSHPDVF